MRRGGAQGCVKSEIADSIFAGDAGLNIAAALAVCLGLRTAARLTARQAIKLRVQAARVELLAALNLLAPFPPLRILWRLGDGLRSSFCLGDFSSLALFSRI